jgi:hypothetical protein
MSLAQAPIGTSNIDITTPNTNYTFIQTLRPSWFLKTTLNLLLGLAGVASFIFLLWGGLQWITAGGDKEGTEKARKRITAALIGLAIVFSAYAILYIIRVLFNVNLIQFTLTNLSASGGSGPPPPAAICQGWVGNPNCQCGGPGAGCYAATGAVGDYTGSGPCYTCTNGGWVYLNPGPCAVISCGHYP